MLRDKHRFMSRHCVVSCLALLLAEVCGACANSPAAKSVASTVPALSAELSYQARDGIRYGCLPRAGDSTHFEIDTIVDSLREPAGASLDVFRGDRPAPRPGITYQAVSVEMRSAGQTRLYGTACWHDAGVGVRGTEAALKGLNIFLDAPGVLVVRVVYGDGRSLGDSVVSRQQGTAARVAWKFKP